MRPIPLDASAAFASGHLLALLRLASHGLKLPPQRPQAPPRKEDENVAL